MPFCPQCNAEYKLEVSMCSDCHVTLVPHPIQMEVTEYGDWDTLESVPNELAGNILQSVLEEDGIPARLRCHEAPNYGGVKGNIWQSEWGDLLVPANLLPQARECLNTYFDSLQDR
ncbi:hypothetical protein F4X88_12350 [Candidatus Poribacteria bacterium]|nr:hypothetical protein [Candidatus Poribacteria bacterium]MYA57081.1 hypothetical protein [Candidatus Poribacteria bacterium]